jgi:hypothetical protein
MQVNEVPSTAIFWARGLEKEPAFAQNVCASDSAYAAVSTSVILLNADHNALS